MTRTEFLEVISSECGFLPPHKRRIVMLHFSELVNDCTADDVTEKLGTPQNALRKYLNTSKSYSKIPTPLFVAALAILSPIIADIAIFLFMLALVLVVFALVLSAVIPLLGVVLWLDGMDIIISSIPMHVMLADKLCQISMGLMCFGGGIIIMVSAYKLYSKIIPWLLKRFAALYEKIEKRKTR